MTVKIKQPRTFQSAIKLLEELAAGEDVLFRGHQTLDHRLKTTLDRYWAGSVSSSIQLEPLKRFVAQYESGLARIGHTPLSDNAHWLDWLEHGRHHGVPAPLLDFTWSPYVALFFAFNRVRGSGKSVVYALSIRRLARHWALRQTSDRGPGFRDTLKSFEHVTEVVHNDLRFVRDPGRYADRMHRQLGVFLLCTLDYEAAKVSDLEGYLDLVSEDDDKKHSPSLLASNGPVLTKVVLRHDWAKDVFKRLELMNVRGATLLPGSDGVAMDVWNGFHYSPKASYVREPS